MNRRITIVKHGECLGTVSMSTESVMRFLAKGYRLVVIEDRIELRK